MGIQRNLERLRELNRGKEEERRLAELMEQNRPVPVKRIVSATAWAVAVSLVLCAVLGSSLGEGGLRVSGVIVSFVAPLVTYLIAIRKGK